MESNKTSRVRRTRNEIKAAMLDAVSKLAKEKPLSQITIIDIGMKAGIRVDVLKRNFGSAEKILSLYAASVDYWVSDLFQARHPLNRIGAEEFIETLTNLINNLYNDADMQRLLLWELTEDNPTTRRLGANREQFYRQIMMNYLELFKDSGIELDIMAAVITAGIYHLILRRKRSTFMTVDFSKRPERKRMIEGVTQMIRMIFNALEQHNQLTEVAKKLKENGVANDVIASSTGLSLENIEEL